MPTAPEKDRTLRLLHYASGNFGKSAVASFVEIFALFFFTDALGLSPSVAGTMLLLSLVWDALADPILGIVADRMRHHLATVRVYFMIGVPATGGALVAVFLAGYVPSELRVLYLLTCLIILRTAYTIVDLPHNSMLAFLSSDARERTNIAGMRIFFSALGKLCVSGAAAYFLTAGSDDATAARFLLAACIIAIVYAAVMANCARAIWSVNLAQDQAGVRTFGMRHMVAIVRSNRRLLITFALTAATSLTTPIIGVTLVYVAKYGLGRNAAASGAITVLAIAQAVSPLFWSYLSKRLSDIARANQYANGTLLVAAAAGVAAITTPEFYYGVAALAGFAFGGIFMLNWSMLPDAMSDSAGRQYDLSVFGLYVLVNKVCLGLSQAFVGWTLAMYGYAADSAVATTQIGPIAATLMALPVAGPIACMLLLGRYSPRRLASAAAAHPK